MPTRKEILDGLLVEAQNLRSTIGHNSQAAEELQNEVSRLQEDVVEASRNIALATEQSTNHLSDRITDLRNQISKAINEGVKEIGDASMRASIVGHVVANILEQQATDPINIMGLRFQHALQIISTVFQAGERNDYNATLRLLRVHEFKAEQARYIVDKLVSHGVLKEHKTDSGNYYLIIDRDSETFKLMNKQYAEGNLAYLP